MSVLETPQVSSKPIEVRVADLTEDLYHCGKAHRFPGFSSTMLVTALHRCYTTEHEALSFQEKIT